MSYTLSVTNPTNNYTWEMPLEDDEVNSVRDQIKQRVAPIDPVKALVIPVRTDSFWHYIQDLLLPTYLYVVSSKVNNFFWRVIASALDQLTLPIRLITSIPRALYNLQQTPIPFYDYLTKHHADKKIFEDDHVKASINFQEETVVGGRRITKNGYEEFSVNFRQLPESVAPIIDT